MIKNKAFAFSKRIVWLYRYLKENKREYVLSKQLVRSGTSIGANVQEAVSAQSKRDFTSKMSIASKEARETLYWLELLCETGFLTKSEKHVQTLLEESEELVKLLTSIVKSSQKSLQKDKI